MYPRFLILHLILTSLAPTRSPTPGVVHLHLVAPTNALRQRRRQHVFTHQLLVPGNHVPRKTFTRAKMVRVRQMLLLLLLLLLSAAAAAVSRRSSSRRHHSYHHHHHHSSSSSSSSPSPRTPFVSIFPDKPRHPPRLEATSSALPKFVSPRCTPKRPNPFRSSLSFLSYVSEYRSSDVPYRARVLHAASSVSLGESFDVLVFFFFFFFFIRVVFFVFVRFVSNF